MQKSHTVQVRCTVDVRVECTQIKHMCCRTCCILCGKVTLTRNNVEEGAKTSPVYAPKYPLFADEGWWVLVGDLKRKTIFSFERITDGGRVVSKEVWIQL